MNPNSLQFGGRHPFLNLRARKQGRTDLKHSTPLLPAGVPQNPQTPGYLAQTLAGCVTWAIDSAPLGISILIYKGSLEPSLAGGTGGPGCYPRLILARKQGLEL